LCTVCGVVAIKKAFEREGTKWHVLPKVKNGANEVARIDFAMVGHNFHVLPTSKVQFMQCFRN
jgi:hypothetical protein